METNSRYIVHQKLVIIMMEDGSIVSVLSMFPLNCKTNGTNMHTPMTVALERLVRHMTFRRYRLVSRPA